MNQHGQQQLQLSQTVGYECEKCGHNIFQSKIMIRKVSRFLTGDKQDAIVPIDIIVCDACNEVAKDLLPKEYSDILFPNVSDAQ